MLSIKLHHFAILLACRRGIGRFRGVQPVKPRHSNYQRKGSPKPARRGCVKDGQGPFDS